jgi:cytosine/adenosine deaminase-related metal-dependent hydrolase
MRFIQADRVFSGKLFLPEGTVLVVDNQNLLKDIVRADEVERSNIERLDGLLSPGFVNTHCHLELSHLKGRIPRHTGLPAFGKQVISQRNNFKKKEISEHVQQADLEMWNNGIVAVGDIGNGEDSFEKKAASKIFYHTFIELIGLNPTVSESVFNKGQELLQILKRYDLRGSLAPHAPYSVSTELISRIADYDAQKNLPFSIHNQESQDETLFFNGKKSGFDELYAFLNVDVSWFKAPKTSSLTSYADVLNRGRSILVHNTYTEEKDISLTKNKNVYWCFCPGANKYIEGRLPGLSMFVKEEDKICLGTDSLASNSQLDLISEANLILNATNQISQEAILQALTYNAAEALGISENYGQFTVGKNAGINHLNIKNGQLHFIRKLT